MQGYTEVEVNSNKVCSDDLKMTSPWGIAKWARGLGLGKSRWPFTLRGEESTRGSPLEQQRSSRNWCCNPVKSSCQSNLNTNHHIGKGNFPPLPTP